MAGKASQSPAIERLLAARKADMAEVGSKLASNVRAGNSLRVVALNFAVDLKSDAVTAGADVTDAVKAAAAAALAVAAQKLRASNKLPDDTPAVKIEGYRTVQSLMSRAVTVALKATAEQVASVQSGAVGLDTVYKLYSGGQEEEENAVPNVNLRKASAADIAVKVGRLGKDGVDVILRETCGSAIAWADVLPVLVALVERGNAALVADAAPVAPVAAVD